MMDWLVPASCEKFHPAIRHLQRGCNPWDYILFGALFTFFAVCVVVTLVGRR